MTINRALLPEGKKQHFSQDIDFSDYVGDENHCKSISSCHVEVDATELDELLLISINGISEIITTCKYTLEDIPLKITFKEDLTISSNEEDDSSYFEPKNDIDLKPYILGLILDKVPHTAIKKGAEKPKDGVGYRILTEEELEEERSKKTDPRWAKLDEIDL